MGKGNGGPSTQTLQPSLSNLPNQGNLESQAQARTYASTPWINSPWRAIDLAAGNAPTQYLPQFTPPGAAGGVPMGGAGGASGGAPGGNAPGPVANGTGFYQPPAPPQQQGVPGFNNSVHQGGTPMQMPGTAVGQQALTQNASSGMIGMANYLQQLGTASAPTGQGGVNNNGVQQPPK